MDYNAEEIDNQYRETEGIVSLDETEKLCEIYNLGKIPSKEYSDIMRKALSDTKVMKELLVSNKDKLDDSEYKKAMASI